jgi:hypothetical protein
MMSNVGHPEKGVICVVDDELPNLKALVRLLRAVELEAVPFDNPRLFLEYVKNHRRLNLSRKLHICKASRSHLISPGAVVKPRFFFHVVNNFMG